MGVVYKAEQLQLGRLVAIKVLHRNLLNDDTAVARFQREARAASLLNHPHSISVLDFGQTPEGQFYLVTEFLRGQSLAAFLTENGGLLRPEQAYLVLHQILSALGEAHELGIVHRDLKPENVFVQELADGSLHAKVLDFGVAKELDPSAPALTSPGLVCGTPEFMAPEQALGQAVDGRADLYAAGVLLYEMLTGLNPFERGSAAETMVAHVREEAPRLSLHRPDLPAVELLDALTARALAKDPGERFQTASEFQEALDTWAQEAEVSRDHWEPEGEASPPSVGQASEAPTPSRNSVLLDVLATPKSGQRLRITTSEILAGMSGARLPGPRAEMLDEIESLLEAGGTAALVGASGLGKTWLLGQLASRWAGLGHAVFRFEPDGVWYPVELLAPLRWVLDRVLGSSGQPLEALQEPDRGVIEAVRRLEPGWWRPSSARRELVVSWLRFLRLLPKDTLFLFDDAERYDDGTQAVLAAWAARRRTHGDVPALCLAGRGLPFLSGGIPSVELEPLPRRALAELLRGVFGTRVPDEVLEESEGSPFLAIQAASAFFEGSVPAGRPAGGQEIMDLRLVRLAGLARLCLQGLTVADTWLRAEDLQRVLVAAGHGQPAQGVESAMESLSAEGWVRQEGEGWAPAHALVSRAVLSSMPAGVRESLCHAMVVGQPSGASLHQRARHVVQLSDAETADLLVLEQAASLAAAFGAPERAASYLWRVQDRYRRRWLGGEMGSQSLAVEQGSVGLLLGYLLDQAGDRRAAEAVLRDTIEVLRGTETPVWLAARLSHDLALLEFRAGRIEAAAELLGAALERAAARHWYLDGRILLTLGDLAARRGDFRTAVERLAEAGETIRGLPERGHDLAWRIPLVLAELYFAWEGPGPAGDFVRQALLAAERAEDLRGSAEVESAAGRMALASGEHASAARTLERARSLCRRIPDRRGELMVLLGLAEARLVAGSLDAAEELLSEAEDLADLLGEQSALPRLEHLRRRLREGWQDGGDSHAGQRD